jgi:hypothetical protein
MMRKRYVGWTVAVAAALALMAWSGITAGAQDGSAGTKAGQPRVGGHAAPHAPGAVPAAVPPLLYNQYDNVSGNYVTSQNFEVDYSTFDAQLADDFVVPSGQTWGITEVDLAGVEDGPVPEVIVSFYGDGGGSPGSLIALRTSRRVDDSGGNLSIKFPKVTVGTGTYWVSVDAQMDYTNHGQWYWHGRTVQSGDPAKWRNPANGWGTGCVDWTTVASCLGFGGPDLPFDLRGRLA